MSGVERSSGINYRRVSSVKEWKKREKERKKKNMFIYI